MDWSNWSPTGSIEDVNNNWKCGAKYQAPSWSNNYSGTMVCGSAANDTSKWNGCVMDRAQNYDTTNDAPATGVTGTWLAADQSPWCPTQMMPLSYNWTNLKAKIDAMSPSGATNQPIGLQWAWFSLSQTAPLNAPAQDPNYKYNNILILMSDGLNTLDRWYGDGSTPNTSVDARQKILCDNIKKAGVTIYTILVNTDGDPPSTVMPYCASGQSNYFPTTSATDMQTAFATIGASLTKLRIAQ